MTKRMYDYDIEFGNNITFKAITRWSDKQVTRIVSGFDHLGRPTVHYGGCDDFVVRLREISQVDGHKVNITKG